MKLDLAEFFSLWSESLAIFNRRAEGFDRLGADVIAVELIEFVEPELVSGVVERRLWRVVRVAYSIKTNARLNSEVAKSWSSGTARKA
jgi:hypothetical protein